MVARGAAIHDFSPLVTRDESEASHTQSFAKCTQSFTESLRKAPHGVRKKLEPRMSTDEHGWGLCPVFGA
jgi:hypothetical protein